MKIVQDGPLKAGWQPLDARGEKAVRARVEAVRRQGDRALRRGSAGQSLAVEPRIWRRAFERLSPPQRAALELACRQVGSLARREHAALKEFDLKPAAGVTLYQRLLPLSSVGMVVPHRRISALLHSAIPAAVAEVERRVVCASPGLDGQVDPCVLAAAYMCDVTEFYVVEGVAAVASLAHGTRTIAPVAKIVGAGDAAVAVAERAVADRCGVSLATGPSELLVLADDTAAPEFVAADLLALAAADPEGSCDLVTTSAAVAEATRAVVHRRLRSLEPDHGARGPLRRAQAVVVKGLAQAVELTNARAPQCLALLVKRPDELVGRLRSYGTLLVGPHTPPALAARVTGAPGLLPVRGAALWDGAVSVSAFLRRVTVQQVDPSAYLRLARGAAALAELEGADLVAEALNERIVPPDEADR